MRYPARRFLTLAGAALIVGSFAACDDENNPITPDPLAAPTGVAVTSTSTTSARVSWSQVGDATSYEVDRAMTGGSFSNVATGLTTTFYEDSGLAPATQYRYVVRSVRGSDKSVNSSETTVTTGTPAPKVAVVEGVSLSRTFQADTTYVLRGFVKVSNGATLTIQAGTKIVGDTLVPGSSLWILRGSKIVANGTASSPIVFTSQRTAGNRAPGDWGGIVVVGNAPINRTANPIFTEGPQGAAENYAGGTDVNDNSGSLKYVRVEFAGFDVSNGGGQELNSISSYAVGGGTSYDYVQSMAGLDDSFEFFGGAADIGHMVSFESGDDHFDWTEGFHGQGQFLLALQTDVLTPRPGSGTVSSDPRGFEGDGCENDKAGCTYANTPYSMPTFLNFTAVGPGTGVFSTTDGGGMVVRRGSGGTFVNGIIARWPGVGVSVRDAESGALMDVDSLMFRNILLVGNGSNFEAVANGRFGSRLSDNKAAWGIQEQTLAAVFPGALPTKTTTVAAANLNVQPGAGSPAATAGLNTFAGTKIADRVGSYMGGSMTATSYVGAVDPSGTPWYDGWTNWVRK